MEATATSRPARPPISRKFVLALLVFLVISQAFLVVAATLPYWWAALPVLALTGVVGWRGRWIFAPILGFVVGAGYWGVQLALLPSGPRERLAGIVAAGAGLGSPTVALLIGPVLLGVLSAFAAATVAGGLRFWDSLRVPEGPSQSEPAPSATEA